MEFLLSHDVPELLNEYIMKIYFILIDYLQNDESNIRDSVTRIVSKTILQQNVSRYYLKKKKKKKKKK